MYIDQICIPVHIDLLVEEKINHLVNNRLEFKHSNNDSYEIENQIEQEIANIIGLTPQEIDFIERSVIRK